MDTLSASEQELRAVVKARMSLPAQLVSAVLFFVGLSVSAIYISLRTKGLGAKSSQLVSGVPWARVLLIGFFMWSWVYLFFGALTVLLNYSWPEGKYNTLCTMSQVMCITPYGVSKLCMYLFMVERVHVVWGPLSGKPRHRSPVYLIAILNSAFYPVILALGLRGSFHTVPVNGECLLGYKRFVMITFASYDVWANVFLTALSLWPLLRSNLINPVLRRTAYRTIVATAVALVSSLGNDLYLIFRHQRTPAWVCIDACALDVLLTASALFWMTSRAREADENVTSARTSVSQSSTRPILMNRMSYKGRHGGATDWETVVDKWEAQARQASLKAASEHTA